MNNLCSVAMIKSIFPYYFKDDNGKKTDKVKGYGVNLMELKYSQDNTPFFSDFTVFLNVDKFGEDFKNMYKVLETVIVEFSMQSATSKPFFENLKKLAEVDFKIEKLPLTLYYMV